MSRSEETLYACALGKRLLSKVDFALGKKKSCLLHIAEAANDFKVLKMPLDHARSLFLHAEMLLEDEPEVAKKSLLQCMETFEHLEAEHDLQITQGLMKKLGVRLPKHNPQKSLNKESELSIRENEVALLVVQGLTNAEIADVLVISPRTVSTHLEKIYRKLEINSRASLVKYLMDERNKNH